MPTKGRPPGTMPAGQALATGVIGLLVAMFLNAGQLVRDAERKEFGTARDISLAIWEPVEVVADALFLTEPRRVADEALGREFDDGSDAFVFTQGSTGGTTTGDTTQDTGRDDTGAGDTTATTVAGSESTDGDGPDSTVADDDGDVVTTAAPTTAAPTTTTTEPARVPTAAAPLDLWVGGDSMTQVFGESFVRLAAETGVIASTLDYRISSGLTRPDFFNWPGRFADVISETDPEVMIVMFGANDAQGLALPTGVFQPFEDEWVAEYSARVGFVMDQLTADSDRLVIWVGQPRMRSDSFDARMQRLNEIYEGQAELREQVLYFDSVPLFSNDSGAYEAFLPALDGAVRDLRQGDGVHLSRPGGDLLADAVLDLLGEQIDLESGAAPETTTTTTPVATTAGV